MNDGARIAEVLQPLGMAALGGDDMPAAQSYLQQAVQAATELGSPHQLAGALNALAQLYRKQGRVREAEALYGRVLELARNVDDSDSVAIALLNLAMVSIADRSADRARERLLDAHAIARDLDARYLGQSVLEVASGLAALLGDWSRAFRIFSAAQSHAAQAGLRPDPADQAFLQPLIHAARSALSAPARSAAEHAGANLGYDAAMADVGEWLRARERFDAIRDVRGRARSDQ
jgi:tetratricopeptide (TPR) repeat protein